MINNHLSQPQTFNKKPEQHYIGLTAGLLYLTASVKKTYKYDFLNLKMSHNMKNKIQIYIKVVLAFSVYNP